MGPRTAEIGAGTAIVVMGVCGVGKTLLAGHLSDALGTGMVEADDFHSEENRRKMAAGIALSEDDRRPWLDAVAAAAERQVAKTGGAVVACSALRRDYRDRLRAGLRSCVFIHLAGPKYLIEQRLTNRQDHFVGRALLESQLKTLEPLGKGEAGFTLDISLPVGVLVQKAMDHLRQNRLAAEDAVTVTDGE